MATAARETTTDPGTLAARPRGPDSVARDAAGHDGPAGDARADRLPVPAGGAVPPAVRLPDRPGAAGRSWCSSRRSSRWSWRSGRPSGSGLILVAYFVLTWGYGAVCEALFNGQTLGKRCVGHPGGLRPGGADHRGAGGAPQPGRGGRRARSRSATCSGLASMILTREVPAAGRPGGGDDGGRRGAAAAVAAWSAVERAGGRGAACPGCRCGSRPGRSWPGPCPTTSGAAAGSAPRLREEMAGPPGPAAPRAASGCPPDASADAVLCAVYHRVFLGE